MFIYLPVNICICTSMCKLSEFIHVYRSLLMPCIHCHYRRTGDHKEQPMLLTALIDSLTAIHQIYTTVIHLYTNMKKNKKNENEKKNENSENIFFNHHNNFLIIEGIKFVLKVSFDSASLFFIGHLFLIIVDIFLYLFWLVYMETYGTDF
jgi:hypothetical protein